MEEYATLGDYARFLLEHYLDELVSINLQRAREVQLPLLTLFDDLPEDQLLKFSQESIRELLVNLSRGGALEKHQAGLQRWKMDQIPGVPKNSINAQDLAFLPHTRKYAMVKLLRHYTQDLAVYEAVIQEIDAFYAYYQSSSLEALLEIQQKALLEEKDFLQTILDNTLDGITAYDKDFRITLWNRSVEERTSFSRKEVLGKNVFDLMPDYQHSVEGRAMQRAMEGEKVKLRDMPFRDREGYYESDLIPFTNQHQQVVGLLAVSRNITDRKRAEQKIIRSENALKEAQAIAHVGHWEFVPATNQLSWSEELYRIYGLPAGSAISLELLRLLIHPQDLPEVQERLQMSMRTGEPYACEHRILLADGQVKTLFSKGEAEKDEQGQILLLKGVSQDITDQKMTQFELHETNQQLSQTLEELRAAQDTLIELNNQLEQKVLERTNELRANEEQLRLLTDALPVSIVYVDSEKRYRFANRTALEWRRGSGNGIVGRKVEEVVGQQTYQTVSGYVDRALSGEYIQFDMPITYPSGQRYSQSRYVPHLEAGEVRGFYALIIDITEQVEARREADRQRKRLHSLFMEAPAPICILDEQELVFELVNPAYQQLLPGRELLGKPLLEALPELSGTPIWQTLRQVFQTGQTHQEKEILIPVARHQNAPLEDVYFNYIQQARYDENSNIDGVIVFAFEVTDQVIARQKIEKSEKEAQLLAEELAVANEEIQASNEELGETNRQLSRINADLDNFIYTASHDLKSPVSNLEGLIQVLRRRMESKLGASESKLMELMEFSILKLKKTIADLVEITKTQKNLEEEVEAVPFAEMLEEVQADVQAMVMQAKAMIQADFQVDQIRFARAKVKSILYNLLSNAIKYCSPERVASIHIQTRQEALHTVLSVRDNGLGMTQAQQAKLFTMFKRMHTHVEGTGIGLYIIKRMVENAGGRIEVESQPDVGSTFRVYFKR